MVEVAMPALVRPPNIQLLPVAVSRIKLAFERAVGFSVELTIVQVPAA
jgi:hypothetical protein